MQVDQITSRVCCLWALSQGNMRVHALCTYIDWDILIRVNNCHLWRGLVLPCCSVSCYKLNIKGNVVYWSANKKQLQFECGPVQFIKCGISLIKIFRGKNLSTQVHAVITDVFEYTRSEFLDTDWTGTDDFISKVKHTAYVHKNLFQWRWIRGECAIFSLGNRASIGGCFFHLAIDTSCDINKETFILLMCSGDASVQDCTLTFTNKTSTLNHRLPPGLVPTANSILCMAVLIYSSYGKMMANIPPGSPSRLAWWSEVCQSRV